jgi:hypothetical protein
MKKLNVVIYIPAYLRQHPGLMSAPKGQVRYYRYSLVVAGKEIGLVVNADKTKLLFMAQETCSTKTH